MRGLDDLVRSGKVHYVGISDTPAWIVSRANTIADLRGWTPFVALQIEYSLIERTPERELLPMAKELDLALTPWGVIGGGMLTGKYNTGNITSDPKRITGESKRLAEQNLAIAAEVVKIAAEIGRPAVQVALNWVRQKKQVVIPIIGARSAKQLAESLDCVEFELSGEQSCRLDKASAIELGFPHDFLKTKVVQDLLFSNMADRLRNHRASE